MTWPLGTCQDLRGVERADAAPAELVCDDPVAGVHDLDFARICAYCADRNSRWHQYDLIEPGTVAELLTEIEQDPTGIFWG